MYQHNSFGVLVKELGTSTFKYLNKLIVPAGKISANGELDLTGAFADGIVATYADLGDALDHSNELWYVETSTGIWLIDYHSSGWYYSNGSSWALMPDSTTASKVKYDNRDSSLASTDVKNALDEADDKYETHADATGDRHDMSHIDVTATVGNPTHINDLNKLYNHMYSSGVMHGCDLADNRDGTVSFTSGHATLRAEANSHTQIYSVEIPAQDNLELINNSTNYIYIDWNGGSPVFNTSDSDTSFNCQDKCIVYYAVRVGNQIGYIDLREQNVDLPTKTRRLFLDFAKFIPTQGGSVISEAGSLGLAITAGSFYLMIRKVPHNGFDTSIAGTANENVFKLHYRDGSGGWTEVADSKTINTTVYDGSTGTPVELGNNKYGVSWVYICNNNPSSLCVVMGQAEYANHSDALVAQPPSEVPYMVAGLGALVGFVIYEKGVTSFDDVLSAFDTSFVSTSPTTHNTLAGLQGGVINEYYHMTSLQYSRIATDGAFYLASPTTDGTWRFLQDAGELKVQKRITGTYVTQFIFSE